jgi:hypothetical protein
MKKYLAILLAVLCSFFGSFGSAVAVNEDKFGRWDTMPYLSPINPIHMALLPDKTLLIVSGSENDANNTIYRAAILNRATGLFTVKVLMRDLFCNAMSFFPGGRVLISGGTKQYDNFYGEESTTVFDWRTGLFTDGPKMADGRWYPTNTTLSNGRTLTISGLYEDEVNNTTEIFTPKPRPSVGAWSLPHETPFVANLYPRGHMIPPDGDVFYSQLAGLSRLFDPESLEWNYVATPKKMRNAGTSVLLPLLPENRYPAKVLIFGGSSSPNTAEIIDLSSTKPAWRYVESMREGRIQLTGTLLPNGLILATGGSKINENPKTASLSAELFDPKTEKWIAGALGKYPRLYHSVAILLPSAKVLVAGSNPSRGKYEKHIEVYTPPYLYTKDVTGAAILAPRPIIAAAPAEIFYAKTFVVHSPDAGNLTKVMLMRLGTVTHGFNMEQRAIGLVFSSTAEGVVDIKAPPNGIIAPPGYYMLFLINSKGVPSRAKIIHLR